MTQLWNKRMRLKKRFIIPQVLAFLTIVLMTGTAPASAVMTAAASKDSAAAAKDAAAEAQKSAGPTESSDEAATGSGTVEARNASGMINGPLSVDPVGHREGYTAVLYDSTNGLPTSEANVIAETGDGFIWIGSYSGLIRYDGNSFVRMDSSTGIASVRCLYVDREDRLWIGTNDSGVFVMEKGEFRNWDEENGLGASSVRSIAQDADGVVYIATTNGIAAVGPDMMIREPDNSGLEEKFVHELRPGSDGLLYGVDNTGAVFTLDHGRPDRYFRFEKGEHGDINSILPDPAAPGSLYVAKGDSHVYHCRCGETSLEEVRTIDISPLYQVQHFEYIDGRIWVCCRNGIGVIQDGKFTQLVNIPMDNTIVNVMTDYAGNLWFSSTRQGVMKIVPNQFSSLLERYSLPETVVNSTCMYKDRLFIGTDQGLTVVNEEAVVSSVPLKQAVTAGGVDLGASDLLDLLAGVRIRSIIRDSRGRLWISTWRGCGLVMYDGDRAKAFTPEDGLFSDQVRMVYERKDGSIIVANTGGVNIIKNGRVTASYTEKDGIVNTEILTIEEGMNGDLLLGSDGDGIYILGKDGITRRIGRAQGLTSEAVLRIKRDREGDFFWVITGTSIACLNADYELTTLNNFPYSNNFDLYENSRGDLWILSSNGIYVSAKKDLLANGKMNPFHFSRSDGLPCITTANSYSELTETGDLYISGTSGVAKVNIEAPFENVNTLKVAVPYLDTDGVRVYPDDSGNFRIPSRIRKITIYSYVYNYSLTNPQVSWQLKGFDREETTVSRSDLDPIDYTNLPGGSYEFTIRLRDSMGRENRTSSVRIVKEKTLLEHPTFYALNILLSLAAVGMLVNLYIRRKLASIEKKHREQVEKERISSELQMASRVQDSMLPSEFPPFPDRSEFDIYASMDPAREVGGDFYDFFLIDDDHLCLCIADVSGKGIPASLFMMVSKVVLQNYAMLGIPPAEILKETNNAICRDNKLEMFITVWVGILEISTGIIRAANAGHEYPALMQNGSFSLLKDRHGLVIGGMENSRYKEYEIHLKPGDKIFLYTDGVPEATNATETLFGTDRMIQALNQEPSAPPEKILQNMQKAVDNFVKDAEQFDDLTMLCLEYKG